MKLKNLDQVWHRNEYCSIFNLPFACYSVQPLLNNLPLHTDAPQKYVVSFKASILYPEPMNSIYDTMTEAEIACEIHLAKLMSYLFERMEDILDFESTATKTIIQPTYLNLISTD
jgi:hypothetical protein